MALSIIKSLLSPAKLSIPDEPPETVPVEPLSISFNQDYTRFTASTSSGFHLFNTTPFSEWSIRSMPPDIRISAVHMFLHASIMALVGPPDHPNKIWIWDNYKCRCLQKQTYRDEVKSVRLRENFMVVVLLNEVMVCSHGETNPLCQFKTVENPKGLCEVSCSPNSLILVCPGMRKGQVRVEHHGLRNDKMTKFFTAHENDLACLALTMDGRFVATASSKGTLFRVFNTLDGNLLQEVRRGREKVEVHSLAFSADAQWLASSSDAGTVHVFSLKLEPGSSSQYSTSQSSSSKSSQDSTSSQSSSSKSSLQYMKGVLLPRYFSSQWSIAQFRLREDTLYTVAFGREEHTIVIVGNDGSFYRCEFDPIAGGEMTQLEYSTL